ncbi:FAD-dependent tricarballylate dehydrogenase TcuA [Streptomyces sp. NPDC050560]|uniref:FAD-dependent tricarballylate dehydrogenase TcuA n=1 Tax=Streptomyces sp. NPDC050560 TaxID=3365630 RepID=UPI0037BC375F
MCAHISDGLPVREKDTSGPPVGQPPPPWATAPWDLVVIGGGNAAVVAAMAAGDLGARVLVVERAPRWQRGGNTRHTRNIRCVHTKDDFNTGDYGFDELWGDLCKVGEGPADERLARFTVADSESVLPWMHAHGARWQKPLHGTLHLGRTNRFFFGGGKALLNSYYREIDRRPEISAVYEAKVEEFEFEGPRCTAVLVAHGGALHRVRAKAVVCASGGFEANLEWLRRYWGDAVDNYVIRGTPHNDGNVLALLYAAGAASAGQERGFHAIALDARAPRFDGGIATRLDTVPFGIAVNTTGRRFHDEGEDVWPKRYASWGRLIADQPGQYAVSLWDAKVNHLFLPPMYGVERADTIAELAGRMGLDPDTVGRTVDEYNGAVVPGGAFDPALLDDCRTKGLTPAKTHWAQRLDTPPYYAVGMRPGITFTYMGVAIAPDARIRREDGTPFDNVYAAGEIMSGNILSTGYMAGFGMTIGSVWGRQAGTEAARRVL